MHFLSSFSWYFVYTGMVTWWINRNSNVGQILIPVFIIYGSCLKGAQNIIKYHRQCNIALTNNFNESWLKLYLSHENNHFLVVLKMTLIIIKSTKGCCLYRTETDSRTKWYEKQQFRYQRHCSINRCLRCRCPRFRCCSCYRCRLRHRI